MHISGVIHTFNEEKNIANVIRSLLPWVDEIVVVDMHSEDATQDIALGLGARVVLHERVDFLEPAREFGIAQTRGDWVIALDADEIVPATLASRLREIADADQADVVMVFRADYIMGALFNWGGWGLDHCQAKFFKKGKVSFSPIIHSGHLLAPGARVLKLAAVMNQAVVHFPYIDASHVLNKMNRYTTIEAAGRHAQGIRAHAFSALKAACRAFVVRYLYRKGYREGWRGLFMCTVMLMYEISIFAKLMEIEDQQTNGPVELRYAAVAEQLLNQYNLKPRSDIV